MRAHVQRFCPGAQPNDDRLLFTDSKGNPIRRTNWSRQSWKPACIAAKVDPAPRFHDLRHHAASWMLSEGVPTKTVQQILGHKSFRMTVDLYGDAMPGADEQAAEILDKVGRPKVQENENREEQVIRISPAG